MKKDNLNPIRLSVVLLLIAAFSGFILSLVYSITQPKIEAYELKKEQESLKIIMPAIVQYEQIEDHYKIYANEEKTELIGYIIRTDAKGYGGRVKCNIGIGLDGKISGIVIGSHSETPGLGSKIEDIKKGESEPYYLRQFRGLTREQLNLENVQTLSGATISSKAVLSCAESAVKKWENINKIQ